MACRLAFLLASLPTLACAADPPSANFKAELRELLSVADDRGPQAQSLAQRRFQSAKSLGDEGVAEYAHALVLLRLNKSKEALIALARAGDQKPTPYLPALKAHVAMLLQQKQWTNATAQLDRVGKAILEHAAWWPDEEERASDADWLGRATSVGQLLATSAADIERFTRIDRHLRKTLTDAEKAAYVAGFDAVIRESEELADTAAAAESTAKVTQEAEHATERDKVKTQQSQTKGERENLKLTADEWKKYLDDKLAEFGKQLGLLEKDWNTLDQRRQSLEKSILLAQQEQQMLMLRGQQNTTPRSTSRSVGGNTVVTTTTAQALDRELGIRQQQINRYQADRDRTLTSMNGIYQQAQTQLVQRQALITDYEHATGKLVQKDEALKKWNDRLQQKEKDLATGPKGIAASVQSLEQKRKSVSTYLPMDWEAERQRWLAELGT